MDQISYLVQLVEEQNHMVHDLQLQIAQLQNMMVDALMVEDDTEGWIA